MTPDNQHYQAIKRHYGEQRAKRSGVLYIQHIDDGLKILDEIGASERAKEAYCLHPIVQDDQALAVAFDDNSVLLTFSISPCALALAMEYRSVANEYLSMRKISSLNEIRLSPLADVQDMLVADKIQNRKDFELYHRETHPRANELEEYFRNWLERLGISEQRYLELAALIRN